MIGVRVTRRLDDARDDDLRKVGAQRLDSVHRGAALGDEIAELSRIERMVDEFLQPGV